MKEMSVLSRKGFVGVMAMVLGCFAASTSHAGSVIQFDPFGTSGANAVGVLQFDEAPGNVVAVNSLNPGGGVVDVPFTVLYQAKMVALTDNDNNPVAFPGFTTPGELTIVASFKEVGTQTSATSASFSTDTDQTGSFVRIYYDTAKNSSDLNGTGFTDGQLIYEGAVQRTPGGGSFSLTGGTTPFDQVTPDNYPGILSVNGAGGSNLITLTTFFDPAFFITDISDATFEFNTSNKTPFDVVNPSKKFFDGTTPNIGAVNGASGPDFQFQSDANASFTLTAVPEPATFGMAALSIVAMLGYGLRKRIA